MSFSVNYIVVIILCIGFESSVINLTLTKKHHFTIILCVDVSLGECRGATLTQVVQLEHILSKMLKKR
jgi:hypothetical protein